MNISSLFKSRNNSLLPSSHEQERMFAFHQATELSQKELEKIHGAACHASAGATYSNGRWDGSGEVTCDL